MATIYTPRAYFARALEACSRLPRPTPLRARVRRVLRLQRVNSASLRQKPAATRFGVLAQLLFVYRFFSGLPRDFRRESLRFAWSILTRCPDQLPGVLACVFLGAHFCRFTAEHVLPELDKAIGRLPDDQEAREGSPGVRVA